MHFPNFLKPVDHGERMTTQLADAKSGRLPSRILTHQLLPNIISLLGRSIMNGWPSIHNRLVQYIRDAYDFPHVPNNQPMHVETVTLLTRAK